MHVLPSRRRRALKKTNDINPPGGFPKLNAVVPPPALLPEGLRRREPYRRCQKRRFSQENPDRREGLSQPPQQTRLRRVFV